MIYDTVVFLIQFKPEIANMVYYPISIHNTFQQLLKIILSHKVDNPIGRKCLESGFYFIIRKWTQKKMFFFGLKRPIFKSPKLY